MITLPDFEVHVIFYLPEWFPPERLNYTRIIRYPCGHIFAGQVERSESKNTALDSIMKLKGAKEIYYDSQGPWILFHLPPTRNVNLQICLLQAKVQRFLNRYKESKNA